MRHPDYRDYIEDDTDRAIAHTFPDAVHQLDGDGWQVLYDDVNALHEEMDPGGAGVNDVYDAALELRTRIGGAEVLPSYVASLLASARPA
jgi:hypothetical protein